jgi:hypothetical protein
MKISSLSILQEQTHMEHPPLSFSLERKMKVLALHSELMGLEIRQTYRYCIGGTSHDRSSTWDTRARHVYKGMEDLTIERILRGARREGATPSQSHAVVRVLDPACNFSVNEKKEGSERGPRNTPCKAARPVNPLQPSSGCF